MKKTVITLLIAMVVSTLSYAAPFAPKLLKLTADPVIQYSFDGSELSVPVNVSGTSAGVIFLLFTKGRADEIVNTRNGYLGWHHVAKIDTCIYYSTMKSFGVGQNNVTWNGKDQDGGLVPPGEYTYYMWAYDNMGAKTMVNQNFAFDRNTAQKTEIQEVDEQGLPMANPIWYLYNKRFKIGSDPYDATLIETATVTRPEGWGTDGKPTMDPNDFNYFYIWIENKTLLNAAIQKFKWVPGSDCELQTDFGENGYSEIITSAGNNMANGVLNDGTYLYTADTGNMSTTEPLANFFIFDFDGSLIKEINMTSWWSSADDKAAGGEMNGGPNNFDERYGMVFLNCRCSCWNQMVDPKGYLESGDLDDFYKWTNGNGDYVLDINYEDTAAKRWVCNDQSVGPYKYTMSSDANLFSPVNAYDAGAVTFGLFAPDGTGLGYFAYAGETAGWKKGTYVVDSGTSFDGLYCDNQQAGGTHYQEGGWKANEYTTGVYYIAHDSIKGVITSAVGVDAAAPAAFSVAQNSPNPFNPTTTISFSIGQAGNVSVEIYNVAGQKIDTIADGFMESGNHSVAWNASDFSAGVYFYTVKAGGFSKTMKMTLLK